MKACTTGMLAIGFLFFAFRHCRDVVVAVCKAGGFRGVRAASFSPDELETERRWIDLRIDGRPYRVDLLVPENRAIRTEPGTAVRRCISPDRQQTASRLRPGDRRRGLGVGAAPAGVMVSHAHTRWLVRLSLAQVGK